jgi:UDPglucose--hexose-1-phosphate uridylyltransferase
MGCSNPHPHCQIWVSDSIPEQPGRETDAFSAYLSQQGECLLCRYLDLEVSIGERLVLQNEDFVVLVPYWAIWPFETIVVSRRHWGSFEHLNFESRVQLAAILKRLTVCYDNLFRSPFPYSMGWHQAPCDGSGHPEWHFHAHYYPPLLRSAQIRKFMVGYEMLATPQRDITAETAAERLRTLPDKHYLEG